VTDMSHDERRDYYRIKDNVGLKYSVCDSHDELPNEEQFASEIPDEYQLINHLTTVDMDSSTLLHSIQDVAPDIGRYLKIINAKIDALARHVVTLGITDDIHPHTIILSAGGVSFISEENIPIDTIIRMSMILYPSCTGILTYGKVVRSEKMEITSPQKYDIAIEYELISETDRDALVRHVLQLQSNYLRKSNV